jgi:hypothetical protein
MMRRFRFEPDNEQLELVPLLLRRKFDRIGLKVSLEQWQALSPSEREKICELSVTTPEQCDSARKFVREGVIRASGDAPKELAESDREAAEPPVTPPPVLVERAKAEGFALDAPVWARLDADERYVLTKLGGGRKISHDFAAALREFIGPR